MTANEKRKMVEDIIILYLLLLSLFFAYKYMGWHGFIVVLMPWFIGTIINAYNCGCFPRSIYRIGKPYIDGVFDETGCLSKPTIEALARFISPYRIKDIDKPAIANHLFIRANRSSSSFQENCQYCHKRIRQTALDALESGVTRGVKVSDLKLAEIE